jgi:hypothetical protein
MSKIRLLIAIVVSAATCLLAGPAVFSMRASATQPQKAETPVGHLKADACGNLVYKDNAYRLSVHVPDAPKEISLLLRPSADKSALSKKLADLGGKQVIVTGEITWLPKAPQVKSDDDWTLGIMLSAEDQVREAMSPLAPAISVEAKGRLTWKDPRYRLIVRPQEMPGKELTLDLWIGESKESKKLIRELDGLKSKEVIVASELQWVPKGTQAKSADDYTLGFAEPIQIKGAKPRKQHDQEKLIPEQAKDALLAMMRSKAGQELGWFKGDIPDEMAKMKIEEEKDSWYAWTAAFRFNPSKAIYTFIVRPKPGARASVFEYEGSFVKKDGVWSATPPKLLRTILQSGK